MGEDLIQKYQLLHKIGQVLLMVTDKLTVFGRNMENIPGRIPERAVMILYAAALTDYESVSNPFIVRLVYMLLVLPADVTMTNVL